MEIGTVEQLDITEKMRSAYLDYAMSVITARALPDVRDGLKPVQRRILYAMEDMGIRHDRPHRKSARIVGEVLGKYHPHGEAAVYDAMVRMAQQFSIRYPLVDGQGNFGSVDGDNAAAMRYTEARLSAIAEEVLADIDKETVDFVDNFDGSLQEPSVLPCRIPNLLLNGATGIAVGMATNIPPHNLGELADAIIFMITNYDKRDDITVEDLMALVPGPDFPTGGIILGTEGIRSAYGTGKGQIAVRSKVHTEDLKGGRIQLVITELPYQVNKAGLIERIATLVRNHKIEGISDLRDESDRHGMRVVIELKRGEEAKSNLEQLFSLTPMQMTFGVNLLALVDMTPRMLPLKMALQFFIEHRRNVLTRRSEFELARAKRRAHILEGLIIALDNLDEVINTIRRSQTADTAKANLMHRFKLSDEQAQAILDLQLRRLAALERKRIEDEYREIVALIQYLEDLLAHPAKILALIAQDMRELKATYGDARRTHIVKDGVVEMGVGSLVPDNKVLVALTARGHIARFDPIICRIGSSGPLAMEIGVRDSMLALMQANAKDTLVFITNKGRAFQVDAHRIPDLERSEEGQPIKAFISLAEDEQVTATFAMSAGAEGYLTIATRAGRVKRLDIGELAQIPNAGLDIIGLDEGDTVCGAQITDGSQELVLVSEQGQAIRFKEEEVRNMGRTAAGVWAIKLSEDDHVAAMDMAQESGELLIATEHGYAKRSPLDEYALQGRYGSGIRTLDAAKLSDTGKIVAARVVHPSDGIVLVSSLNNLACLRAEDVPTLPRASWGAAVRDRQVALKLGAGETLVAMALLGEQAAGESRGPEPMPPLEDEGDGHGPATAPAKSHRAPRSRPAPPKEMGDTPKAAPASESRGRARAATKPGGAAGSKRGRAPAVTEVQATANAVKATTRSKTPVSATPRSQAEQPSLPTLNAAEKAGAPTPKAAGSAKTPAAKGQTPAGQKAQVAASKSSAKPASATQAATGKAAPAPAAEAKSARTPPRKAAPKPETGQAGTAKPAALKSAASKATPRAKSEAAKPASRTESALSKTTPASASEAKPTKAEPPKDKGQAKIEDSPEIETSSRTSERKKAAIEAAKRVAHEVADNPKRPGKPSEKAN